MKLLVRILLLPFLFLLSSSPAMATITLSNDAPKVGEKIVISFDVPVDTLTITYRPNSSVAKTEVLVNRPPATSFEWASKDPGLVELSYLDKSGSGPVPETRNVSIYFSGLSFSGLAVMVFAGFILFGGVGFAFRTLFRDEDGTMNLDPNELPDT